MKNENRIVTQRFTSSRWRACAFLLAVAGAVTARASVLTFNIDNNPGGTPATSQGSLLTTHAAYGDFINAAAVVSGSYLYNYDISNGTTPNVAVTYGLGLNGNEQYYYTDGDGTPSPLWADVDFLVGGAGHPPSKFTYTFTPDAGYAVRVNSFDVFGYNAATSHTSSWTLYEDTVGGTVIASGGPTAYVATIASPHTVVTGAGFYGGTVVLEVVHDSGNSGGWGLDNLSFSQAAPEPASMLLLGVAALPLLWRRR